MREIVREKKPFPMAKLMTSLGISRRNLYYDLPKINDWLTATKLGKIETIRGQLTLITDDFRNIERLLSSFSSYVFSVEERRALIVFAIAASASPISISALQKLLDVSRNTVLGDIRECKNLLEPQGVFITSSNGYRLEGNETAIRKIIGRQSYELKNEYPQSVQRELLQEAMAMLSKNCGMDFIAFIKDRVEEYEHSLGTWLVFDELFSPETMILFACIRSATGYPYPLDLGEKEALANTREHKAVLHMMSKFFEAGINLQMDEAYYVTILLLGVKNFDFSSNDAESDFIRNFTIALVDNFEKLTCVNFEGKHQFLSRLYLHIRPMYFRLKYGIHAGGTLSSQIRSMYAIVFEFTQEALARTNVEMSNLINDEELAYLCIYMASQLGEDTAQQVCIRPQILIICGAGVATSVLLREQLIDFLGDAFTYHYAPARKAAKLDFSDYTLVVTTIALEVEDPKIIHTVPILSEENRERIIDMIYGQDPYSEVLRDVEEIMEIVQKNAKITDSAKLKSGLIYRSISKQYGGVAPLATGNLQAFLQTKKAIVYSEATTSKQALSEASQLLGLLKTKDHKEPFEIIPGIGLVHFQKDFGSIDFKILLFNTPITWGQQRIKALVVVATIDNFTHFPLLQELYKYLKEEDRLC